MQSFGRYVFSLGVTALGGVGLLWRDFAGVWQPVPDAIVGRVILACIAGLVFLGGGVALASQRCVRPASALVGAVFLTFAVLWIPRIVGHPMVLATWSGCGEELAAVFAAIILYTSRRPDQPASSAAITGFGICVILFGLVHFMYPAETAAMVPRWAPGGTIFWAYATGLGHFLAGCAIVTRIHPLLAARLLTAMFLSFNLFVWGPLLAATPRDHVAWAGNALNLALVGAAWVVADAIARATQAGRGQKFGKPVERALQTTVRVTMSS